MSVQTQMLAETIDQIEQDLLEAKNNNDSNKINELTEKKAKLARDLSVANSPLKEGRQLLKG